MYKGYLEKNRKKYLDKKRESCRSQYSPNLAPPLSMTSHIDKIQYSMTFCSSHGAEGCSFLYVLVWVISLDSFNDNNIDLLWKFQ